MIILNIKKRLVVTIEVLVASEPVGVTCIKIYARQKKKCFYGQTSKQRNDVGNILDICEQDAMQDAIL